MADHIDGGRLRRKRRKLGRREEDAEFQEEEDVDQNVITSPSSYNFLHLVSLILEHDIPILFPGGWRPRNAYALIGAGGSFLVFKEERTMSDLILSPEQIRSLEERMVLKRTRQHDEKPHHRTDPSSGRYLSIMSELQILLDPDVQAHENIIDLHGLTWDFEPEDNGSFSVWPVLGLEAAECSLQSLMYEYNESEAPLSTRLEYCYNVAAALEFLHARGVAHCDVKLENVLACVTQRSGSMGKLSDFGSAVLGVDKDTFLPTGVAGSPPWNAPEYRRPLRGVEILKLDVFSFGMFLWRFTARSPTFDLLESAGTEREKMIHDLEELKMSESLLRLAIREMNGSYVNSDELDPVIEILEKTLAPFAEQRCSMAEVCSILARAVTLESGADVETENAAGMQEYEPDMHTEELLQNDHTDKDDDSARSVNPILPIPFEPFYNDFERFYEEFEDESPLVKAQLIRSLKECAISKIESASAAAESAYHLTLCYINGFGVQQDPRQAWQFIMQSARLRNPKARAQAYRLYRGLFPKQELSLNIRQEMTEWLQEAVFLGSIEAAQDLLELDPRLHRRAIRNWEKRFCQIDPMNTSEIIGMEDLIGRCKELSPADLNELVLNERGYRPIHLAASLGDTELLRELLRGDIEFNCLNGRGESPLLCACRANEPEAALLLMSHGASPVPATSGESPLHWLIAMNGPRVKGVAQNLVKTGAKLEQQYNDTENNELTFDIYPHGTPLDWAVSKRSLSTISLLIELGADPFNACSQFTAFARAASAHDWEVLRILLRSKHATSGRVCALEATGHSILFEAIYCNHRYERVLLHGQDIDEAAVKTIRALVDTGCDPSIVDKDRSSVMHILAGFGDYDFVKLLVNEFQFGIYVDVKAGPTDRTPLHHAMASGNAEIFKLLVERGADTYIQVSGYTILHLLALMEDENCAELCLKALDLTFREDKNILVRSKDFPEGLTAFELAVHASHLKTAQLLLEAGCDPTSEKDRDRHFVALLIALPSWDSSQALEFYLDRVETPFIVRDTTALSVLHVGASMMHYLADSLTGEQKFDTLLKRFSSNDQIDAITKSSIEPEVVAGQTPLHYAAKFGVYYAARKLLQAGANPNIKDHDGKIPLDLARSQLASLEAMVMEHENFHAIKDLKSTVSLLERPQALRSTEALQQVEPDSQMPTRFSRLGFVTQPSGQE